MTLTLIRDEFGQEWGIDEAGSVWSADYPDGWNAKAPARWWLRPGLEWLPATYSIEVKPLAR